MKRPAKIKAGALQFVLFIGAIVAVLLMSFVLISYTHTFFGKKTNLTVAVIQQADFGLRYALQNDLREGHVLEIPSEEHPRISTSVRKEYWGLFEKYTATAEHRKIVFTKTALVANGIKKGLPAIYLTDRQRPLIIAGNAKITGDAYLPAQGIRMGNISGNSYRSDRLVYGRENVSSSVIPKLNEANLAHLGGFFKNYLNSRKTVALRRNMELKNSFETETKYVIDRTIRLENISLTGNIIVTASEKIIVEPSALLRDIILIAPEIIIKNKVKGSFQALAKKSIAVGKGCELFYPSALMVNDGRKETGQVKTTEAKLFIDTGAVINGTVIYLDTSEEQTYAPQIKISEKALIRGEVYCSENLELKGTVIGNVTTNGFIALENGSIYQNHLYNGHIDSSQLPEGYVGLGVGGNRSKAVMKWLY